MADETEDSVPASVVAVDAFTCTLHSITDIPPPFPSTPKRLWDYLRYHGVEWMWDGVEEEDQDLAWLVDGVRENTFIAVADGSYDRKGASDVSGAGWVLCCTSARKILRGNFYEISKSAGSYRGKLLGLLAIHHLILSL